MTLNHPLRFLALTASFVFLSPLLVGCDNASPSDSTSLNLTLEASSTGLLSKTFAIEIDEVKVLLKTIKFKREEHLEEMEFHSESIALNLDLSGQPTVAVVGQVPPGSYRRVDFKIHKPEDFEEVPDAEFRVGPSGDQRFSMIIRGRVDGEPFTVRLRRSMQQQIDLLPPLEVSADDAEVTVVLHTDLSRWFVGEDGKSLDPRFDEDEIADAVKASFKALGRHGD